MSTFGNGIKSFQKENLPISDCFRQSKRKMAIERLPQFLCLSTVRALAKILRNKSRVAQGFSSCSTQWLHCTISHIYAMSRKSIRASQIQALSDSMQLRAKLSSQFLRCSTSSSWNRKTFYRVAQTRSERWYVRGQAFVATALID